MHWGEVLDKKLAALPAGAAAVWAAVSVLRLRAGRARHGCIIVHAYDSAPGLPGLSFPLRVF